MEIRLSQLQGKSIFVATPMYGGMCHGTYAKSNVELQGFCVHHSIPITFFHIFNESLIPRARNYCVDEFLRATYTDKNNRIPYTHMMFIDSDIQYNPLDVIALLAMDKDIACGPYPKKTIAWEKVIQALNSDQKNEYEENPNLLNNITGDYVFNPVHGQTQIKINEPVEVLESGTGFMMIKREVFEKFKQAYPEYEYKPDHNRSENFNGTRMIHSFFDTIIDPKTKRYLSEDYFFCQKCKEIGIRTWLCPWMKLSHTFTYMFQGDLESISKIKSNHGGPPIKE